MSNLELDALAPENRPVLTPAELERLPWREDQRNERFPSRGLLLGLPVFFPTADESRERTIGAVLAKSNKIGVQLPRSPPLLAGPVRLGLQPA